MPEKLKYSYSQCLFYTMSSDMSVDKDKPYLTCPSKNHPTITLSEP